MKEKFLTNMLLFGKKISPNTFSVKSPKFHYEIVAELQDLSVRFLNIIAPRGHAKSSLVALIFVLWHCFVQPLPSGKRHFVVLVSKTSDHAIKLLQSIKDVLNYSLAFRALFGYHGEQNAIKWAESEVQLDNGVVIVAKGMGKQLVGLKVGDQRPTLIILDDPEDDKNTKTAEAMEANLIWFLKGLFPMRDPQIGRVVVIGTPQHERCIVETLAIMSRWKTMRFSAIINMGKPEEEALWPEWKSLAALYEEKDECERLGRVHIFYSEYQCQVVGGERQIFKAEYLKYYDGHITHQNNREAVMHLYTRDGERFQDYSFPVNIYMGIDPASSTRNIADPSVIFPIAIDNAENIYCLPYFRGRLSPMDAGAKVIEWFRTYKPMRTSIESVGYQEMLRDYLKSKVFIPGLEIKWMPRDKKSLRLESVQPYFAQRKVFLLTSMTDFVDELLLFPKSKHDDILDAFWYALRHVKPPHHEKEEAKAELTDHMKYYIGLQEFSDDPDDDDEDEMEGKDDYV